MHLRKFYFLTLFLKLYLFFSIPPHAISSPCKTLLSFSRKFGHLVIWSFCRFLCFVIGFAANLLKIGGNESRRRTISFSSYSIGLFPFILSVLSFPVFFRSFPSFFFFLFLSFLLSIYLYSADKSSTILR